MFPSKASNHVGLVIRDPDESIRKLIKEAVLAKRLVIIRKVKT